MDENDIKQLKSNHDFKDFRSIRILAQNMYKQFEDDPKPELKLMANILGESLHKLTTMEEQVLSEAHPKLFNEIPSAYEQLYTNIRKYHFSLLIDREPTLTALHKRGKKLENLSDLKDKLVSALADVAMLSLNKVGSKAQKIDEMIEAQNRLNELRNIIFSYIVSSPLWDKDEAVEYQKLMNSTAVDSVTSQLMVSAITLSCLYLFDRKKFQLLFKLAKESKDMNVRARAWVGWVLCSCQIPGFMVEMCAEDIQPLKDDEEGKDMLLLISKLFLRSQNMDDDSQVMMKNMLHGMVGKGNGDDGDGISDSNGRFRFSFVSNHDDEMEEDNPLEETMELLKEGADIYFMQFKQTKKLGFFHSMYNWFMPFYFESPLYLSVMKKAGDKECILHLVLQNGTTCDSDRYSLLLLLDKEKNFFEKGLDSMMPDEITEENLKAIADDDHSEMDEKDRKRLELKKFITEVLHYIHDLSRFFNLAPMSKMYGNLIDKDAEGEEYSPLMLPIFKDRAFDGLRYKMARHCVKRNNMQLISPLMGEHYPDTVENHYMIAWAAVKSPSDKTLSQAYPHIDFLMKEAPEQFQLVELAVDFYEKIAKYQKAADCLIHLMEIKKDDEKAVRWCKKRLAEVYVLQERYEEAVKLYYEITYLEPDNLNAIVELSEALLYMNNEGKENLDKAEKYMDSALKRLHEQRVEKLNMNSFSDNSMDKMNFFFSTVLSAMDMDFGIDFELYKIKGMLLWARNERSEAMKAWFKAYEAKIMVAQKDIFFDKKQEKWLSEHGLNDNMRLYLAVLIDQHIRQGVNQMMDGLMHD